MSIADSPTVDNDPTRSLTDKDLGVLQFSTLLYYIHETNPDNGLVRDKTDPNAPASIAAIGMALATIPVVVERGVLFRDFAVKILAFDLGERRPPEGIRARSDGGLRYWRGLLRYGRNCCENECGCKSLPTHKVNIVL